MQSCIPECTEDIWSCGDWGACSVSGNQTRICTKTKDCLLIDTPSPITIQPCTYIPPVCASWTYSTWSSCSSSGTQTRNIISSSPSNCTGGSPILSQSCNYIPPCTTNNWSCNNWSDCSIDGIQIRTCDKNPNCQGGVASPATKQSCSYVPACTPNNWSCGSWSNCAADSTQTRRCSKIGKCEGGVQSPSTAQSCVLLCTAKAYSCTSWSVCSQDGVQTRTCNKAINCEGGTPPPDTSQKCTPPCDADIWSCGDWSVCSPNGIQTRSCKRTYDCPSAETPPPTTSQYCQTSQTLLPQPPSQDNFQNSQDTDLIVQATVKLACYKDRYNLDGVGSGTVISQDGVILTNRHVVEGTIGCWVGFQNSIDDALPDYREIADISKISADQNLDVALLKIRKNGNQTYQWMNITSGSNYKFRLKERIYVYGYPVYLSEEKQKTMSYKDQESRLLYSNMTATDGLYGGNYANIFIKTGAKIEPGNSGGGAYSENGSFIGMPTAGLKGELESLGLVLTSQKINQWINNSRIAINNLGSTISPVLQKVSLENTKFVFLDVSNAKVNIYSDKSKKTLLPNNPETIQKFSKPVFQISNIDGSEITGYYMYFGTNINADPVKKGKLIKKSEYTPSTITQKGVYYFIFRAKNKNGNVSESVITEYRYKK